MRFFVSFSSKDTPYAGEIMSALNSQQFDFWDYSDKIQQIEAGTSITGRLKEEIDGCDYFITLISDHSMNESVGKFTRMELEYAIEKGMLSQEKIIPILLFSKSEHSEGLKDQHNWNGPFKKLVDKDYLEFTFEDYESYVRTIESICNRVKKIYVPAIEAHKRLPFWKLFREEVRIFSHDNYTHVDLMRILGEFNEYYKRENTEYAYVLISHFISCCKYRIPDYTIFYPWLVKAVCEQKLGMMEEAFASYKEAEQIKPGDENAAGGIASVYEYKEDHRMAFEYYKKSYEYCPPDQNSDERLNLAIASMNFGKDLSENEAAFLLNYDETDCDDLEKSKILTAKGLYYYLHNNYIKAIPFFEALEKDKISSDASIIFNSFCYQKTGHLTESIQVLKRGLEEALVNKMISTKEIYYVLADRYLEAENTSGQSNYLATIEIYEKHLLTPENRDRFSTIKYARLMHHLKKQDKVNDICNEMLSGNIFPLPTTKEDFYFDGWANYLLGRIERAKYDYQRSNNYLQYYDMYK